MSLASMIEQGQLWRGQTPAALSDVSVEPSGYADLDRLLVGGGWLRGQLVELLYRGEGRGELRLLWPLLRRLSTGKEPLLLWVDPPHHPYPLALLRAGIDLSAQHVVRTRALKERLWVLEQALKSGCCPLVLGWLDARLPAGALRRLQLAAAEGDALGWIFRPDEAAAHNSPAAYRLHLHSGDSERQVDLTLLKRRAGWPLPAMTLELPAVV